MIGLIDHKIITTGGLINRAYYFNNNLPLGELRSQRIEKLVN